MPRKNGKPTNGARYDLTVRRVSTFGEAAATTSAPASVTEGGNGKKRSLSRTTSPKKKKSSAPTLTKEHIDAAIAYFYRIYTQIPNTGSGVIEYPAGLKAPDGSPLDWDHVDNLMHRSKVKHLEGRRLHQYACECISGIMHEARGGQIIYAANVVKALHPTYVELGKLCSEGWGCDMRYSWLFLSLVVGADLSPLA